MSYVHIDDRQERLTAFSNLLSDEVRVQTGEEFIIFQDRKDIKWGQSWKKRIEESLDRVTFLIAFITPSFFKSQHCRTELQRFLRREEQLDRNDLILPIYYVECDLFSDEELLEKDELAQSILSRHYIDWRDLRFKPMDSLEVGERMSHLANQIRDALQRVKESERYDAAESTPQQFAQHISNVEPGETYTSIVKYSSELLSSERVSLILCDEDCNVLFLKAAIGAKVSAMIGSSFPIGETISGGVIRSGRPLVVSDIELAGYKPAPPERGYKTKSFICFPIIIRGKSCGVLNFTDKVDGGTYSENDLRLLEAVAPQMALALDRAEWYSKATLATAGDLRSLEAITPQMALDLERAEWESKVAQFQVMSITDPLTGMLNRRYMEERLSEELERSKRHQFLMSFLMVDVDDFKTYNDVNGHQEGDLALEMLAQCLKASLRSADVASRYGGEEFSILLPQTSLSEARVIAERIRRRVEKTSFPHGKTQPLGCVTVSIGISAFTPQIDTSAKIIYAADKALYLAKSRGKNCVQEFE